MRANQSPRQRNADNRTSTGVPPVPPEGSPKANDVESRGDASRSAGRMDVRQVITDRIIAMLEKGGNVFRERWTRAASRGMPRNGKTGAPYHGAHVLLLWDAAIEHGYASNVWLTYKQAAALGAQVRKGESGATIVYYGDSSKTVHDDASGEDKEQGFRFLKTYTVFNVAQIDGLPERYHDIPEPAPEAERIAAAEAFFAAIPANVNHGGDKAYYMPSADRIQLPPFAAFHDAHGYYATRGHETVHNAVTRIMPHGFG